MTQTNADEHIDNATKEVIESKMATCASAEETYHLQLAKVEALLSIAESLNSIVKHGITVIEAL